jgi:uncharacterized repeat protein (TIGR01451 family)
VLKVGQCQPYTLSLKDINGNPVTATSTTAISLQMSQTIRSQAANCATDTASIPINTDQSQTTVYLKSNTAGLREFTATSSTYARAIQRLDVSSKDAATKLRVLGQHYTRSEVCSLGYTVLAADNLNNDAPFSADKTVAISATDGAALYGDANCTQPISQLTIPSGWARTNFYLKRSTQNTTINATAEGLTAASFAVSNPWPTPVAEYYVSPTGSPSNLGTKSSPWDLTSTLKKASHTIQPGAVIWLLGGTYGTGRNTTFESDLAGTETLPITIRQYPGERAIVNGYIGLNGAWTTLWGFEVTNTSLDRKVNASDRPAGIGLFARGNRAINMVVHDAGHPGIGFWNPVGDGGETYGSLLWGNGVYDLSDPRFPDGWTRGSAIYAQNTEGNRIVADMISFWHFTTGMKAYTANQFADGFQFEGNTTFNNASEELFIASENNGAKRARLANNYIYGGEPGLGYSTWPSDDVIVENNYFPALAIQQWRNVIFRNNTIFGPAAAVTNKTLIKNSLAGDYTRWNNNRYFSTSTQPFQSSNTALSFANWKTTTQADAQSTLAASEPAGTWTFVRPNQYEEGRGHVTVYNWDDLNSTTVDLSKVLNAGDNYEILDAQNYLGSPIATGTYGGGNVTIPLNNTAFSQLVGNVTHFTNSHTPKEFNAFVVRKTNTEAQKADIKIVQTANRETITGDETLTYTFAIENVGTKTATPVVVANTLPSGTTFVAASDNGQLADGVIKWSLTSLAAGETKQVTLEVKLTE